MITKICKICLKKFLIKPYRIKKAKYCSRVCKGKDRELCAIIFKKGSETKKKRWKLGMYQPPWNKGLSVRLSIKTEFKKGSIPWNKNKKGIHLSPRSQFKKGRISETKMSLGSIVKRNYYNRPPRLFRKIGEPNKWEQNARYIWKSIYGDIPKGYIIHHKDRNTLNDDIENLDCLSRAEHLNEHRGEFNI